VSYKHASIICWFVVHIGHWAVSLLAARGIALHSKVVPHTVPCPFRPPPACAPHSPPLCPVLPLYPQHTCTPPAAGSTRVPGSCLLSLSVMSAHTRPCLMTCCTWCMAGHCWGWSQHLPHCDWKVHPQGASPSNLNRPSCRVPLQDHELVSPYTSVDEARLWQLDMNATCLMRLAPRCSSVAASSLCRIGCCCHCCWVQEAARMYRSCHTAAEVVCCLHHPTAQPAPMHTVN
jgi:hypothetical protein